MLGVLVVAILVTLCLGAIYCKRRRHKSRTGELLADRLERASEAADDMESSGKLDRLSESAEGDDEDVPPEEERASGARGLLDRVLGRGSRRGLLEEPRAERLQERLPAVASVSVAWH